MNRDKIEYKYKSPRSYQIPKQTWVQRNIRLVVSAGTFTALLIFFSRPLYDAFLRPESEYISVEEAKRLRR